MGGFLSKNSASASEPSPAPKARISTPPIPPKQPLRSNADNLVPETQPSGPSKRLSVETPSNVDGPKKRSSVGTVSGPVPPRRVSDAQPNNVRVLAPANRISAELRLNETPSKITQIFDSNEKDLPTLCAVGSALAVSIGTAHTSVAYWSEGGAGMFADGSGSTVVKSCIRKDNGAIGKTALRSSGASKAQELVMWLKRQTSVEEKHIEVLLKNVLAMKPQFSHKVQMYPVDVKEPNQATLVFCLPSAKDISVRSWRNKLINVAQGLGYRAAFVEDPTMALLHVLSFDFSQSDQYCGKRFLSIVAGAGYVSWGVSTTVSWSGFLMQNVQSVPFGTYDMVLWLQRLIWDTVIGKPTEFDQTLATCGERGPYFLICENFVDRLLAGEDVDFSSETRITDVLAVLTGKTDFLDRQDKMVVTHSAFKAMWADKFKEMFALIASSCNNSQFSTIMCCGKASMSDYFQNFLKGSFKNKDIQFVPEPTSGCVLGAAFAVHASNMNMIKGNFFV